MERGIRTELAGTEDARGGTRVEFNLPAGGTGQEETGRTLLSRIGFRQQGGALWKKGGRAGGEA